MRNNISAENQGINKRVKDLKSSISLALLLSLIPTSGCSSGLIEFNIQTGERVSNDYEEEPFKEEQQKFKNENKENKIIKDLKKQREKLVEKLNSTNDYQKRQKIYDELEQINNIIKSMSNEKREINAPQSIFFEIKGGSKKVKVIKNFDLDTEERRYGISEDLDRTQKISIGERKKFEIEYKDGREETIYLFFDGNFLYVHIDGKETKIVILDQNKDREQKMVYNRGDAFIIFEIDRRQEEHPKNHHN